MSQPAEPKPAEPKPTGQRTDEFIKDIQEKLQGNKYIGKADVLQKDLTEVNTKIRRYEREVKTLTNPETPELIKKAKDFLAVYKSMLKRLLEIKKGLIALSRPNTSTSATALANALSGLKLAPTAPAAAGGAAPAPAVAGGAAAPPAVVQEVHVCPADRDEFFRLGGDELKDGNCFYSSVYRAALHHSEKGLVNRIYELFGGKPASNLAASAGGGVAGAKPIPDEGTFIRTLRAKTAHLLRNDVYQEIKVKHLRNINADKSILTKEGREGQKAETLTLFEKLWDNQENEIYRAWLQEAPWQIQNFFKGQSFRSIYTSRDPKNEKKFCNDMADIIKKWGVYASETDISVVKHVLSEGGIALEAVSKIDTKKCMYFGRMPVLWLFKQAYRNERGELISGNHFGYFTASLEAAAAAASTAAAAAANAENAAAFGLTPAELKEQKEAWAKLKGQKPPGNPRKTRKLLRRSRSRRIQRKA